MGQIRAYFLIVFVLLLSLSATAVKASEVRMQDVIKVLDQAISPGSSVDLPLPALPAKHGKVIILKLRAITKSSAPNGTSYVTELRLNGASIGAFTSDRNVRLIGRDTSAELTSDRSGVYSLSDGKSFLTVLAPDTKTGDSMTKDGQGATFVLDISDLARGVDCNTLTIRNNLNFDLGPGWGKLIVQGIEIGWVDKNDLPKPENRAPVRGSSADAIKIDGLTLSQSRGGGFSVRMQDGGELLVETALGMNPDSESALISDDAHTPNGVVVDCLRSGYDSYRMSASWPGLHLVRTLTIRKGLLVWKERWTNTQTKIIGVPFRHRLFLRGKSASVMLGGSSDLAGVLGCSSNPTVFMECIAPAGNGFGVTAENDWLRLLMSLRSRRGVQEIYSENLALAPNSSIDFELSIIPVKDGGGYWTFINDLRRRWGVNGLTAERPVFWNYALSPAGSTPEEKLKRSLAGLGPICVAVRPWVDLEPDALTIKAGKYPHLAASETEVDVDKYLTYKHRESYWKEVAQNTASIHKICPNTKVIQMIHPSMEATYMPQKDKWPISQDAILKADGSPFEDIGYSRMWLDDYTKKGWSVLYYVPRPRSAQLKNLLSGMARSMDKCNNDGMYSDEFSWAYQGRVYSRYDYSRWDGYSADLDLNGEVVRLKTDNAHVTESCQMQMFMECSKRGKFFLTNGGRSLRSITSLPFHSFVEGGNGSWFLPLSHLNPVPLVLGNMGDTTTLKGVLASVRECLSVGCVYSPPDINLLLKGPDNFVCKLYPITIEKILPGTVIGKERTVTYVSGEYTFSTKAAAVRVYRYGSDGRLLAGDPVMRLTDTGKLRIDVPEQGLVIAEIVHNKA